MDLENLTLQTEEILELTPSHCQADIYNHSSHNSIIDISEESELNISLKLIPCQICSRTFNPVTLQKHVKICEKMATKKRNVFDSSRQRREGTELASYPSLIKNSQTQKPMQTVSPILTRKKPINELSRKTICASMRKQPSSTSNLAQISPTGTIITETSEAYTLAATSNFRRDRMRSSERLLSKRTQPLVADQCPYCERCFGVKAYDRHVEWCKEKALQASIKLSSKNEQNVAKERLEARTKYRAPCLKTKRSINREKYAGLTGDEKDSAENPNLGNSIYKNNNMNSNNMSLSLTSSITSETGRLEAYDPFLSAKRQLEDLCSPSTAISAQATSNLHPQTHQSPNTPKIHSTLCKSQANRMTSSIISSSHEGVIIQNSQGLLSNLATKSNFRRTSSLRGTRQSPMLSSRPFLTQKLRPSIQRGLSDEGPISTNFLKPEEYDEMPVRAVCVNDFAVSNTPRVLRRDTISSNRKNNFKTNVSLSNPSQSSAYGNQENTSKFVAKTDSLTIFLKYENDVDNVSSIPAVAPESPVITKELKEKNNTLSKQNSAKNIIAEAHEYQKQTTELQNSPNWSPDLAETRKFLDNAKITLQANNSNLCSNNKTNQKSFEQIKNWDVKQVHQQSQPTISVNKQPTHKLLKKVVSPILNVEETKEPIRLTSILDDSRSKELNMSDTNGIEFIDPKLINKYDNLPVNVTAAWTLNHSNDELSVKSLEYSPSPSECSKVHADTLNLHKCRTSQHWKVKDLESAVFSKQNSLPVPQNLPQGRNLLQRKMRLGRNQFLYDESPHIDHCSGKDEALRSSVEYDDKHFTNSNLYCTQFPQKQPYISSPPATAEVPPLPFDEFDFDGFLLSFKTDENQSPLFKDCREFLMNRSSNKHRSAIISTSEFISDNTNIQTNSLQHQPQHVNTFNPTKLPNFSFQSFNNQQNTDSLLNTSSFRTKSNKESLESNQSEIYKSYNDPKSASFGADFGEVDKKKREIFISIETEQNAHGRSGISPDSLRSILGDNQNPQVEEVCDNDNKFSKIEDDDRLPNCPTSLSLYETKKLPNIEINNAKNLIQQMQESFRQMGEEASTCLRQAVINSTPRSSTASNSFFDNSRSPLSTERSEIAENVTSLIEGDSDEASSLESYPVSSQSSRRGVASKLSADSAYGSLSRQKSSDCFNLNCHQIRARPSTASCGTNTALVTSMIDAATQHKPQKLQQQQPKNKYTSNRTHSRQFSGNSSTSGSEISLPQIVGNVADDLNKNFLDHQEMSSTEQNPHQQMYDNNANKNTCHNKSLNQSTALITSETKSTVTVETSADARTTLNSVTPTSCSSYSLNNPSMTSSLKMSRFCHECGSRFLIDEAKFCMDCGVKRLIL